MAVEGDEPVEVRPARLQLAVQVELDHVVEVGPDRAEAAQDDLPEARVGAHRDEHELLQAEAGRQALRYALSAKRREPPAKLPVKRRVVDAARDRRIDACPEDGAGRLGIC